MIVIFPSNSTSFSTNGLGNLSDAASCLVTEERNGKFELEMTYPVDGMHYSEIGLRKLILAKPDPYSDPQPFRIYSITKPMNGIITVNAEHISYDLTGYPVKPFTATGVVQALSKISSNAIVSSPFSFYTNKTETTAFKMEQPSSIRSVLGSDKGSILGTYGGEFKFDKYSVRLLASRGSNNGVTIRYGKNLTDLNQEEIGSTVYSAVYPFWYSDGTLVELSPKTIAISGVTGYTRIFPLDLTQSFSSAPSVSELRAAANAYISENDLGSPEINLELEFIELNQVVGYEDFAALESVQLCDIVTVIYPLLGISAVAKCITTVYDVISGKYQSVELGTKKSDLSNVESIANDANNTANGASATANSASNSAALTQANLEAYISGHFSIGSYVGDGTHSYSGGGQTIELAFTPSVVIIFTSDYLVTTSGTGEASTYFGFLTTGNVLSTCKIVDGGFYVSDSGGGYYLLNAVNKTYYYIAML